jgi:hypothetical protein
LGCRPFSIRAIIFFGSFIAVFTLLAVGVGHPKQSLSDMRSAEARSAQIDRPAGVARCFQVSLYKVDPSKSVFTRNLLTKDDTRSTLADEVEKRWP